jgi:hypothetical protein
MAQASLQVPQPEHFSWITVGIMDDAPLKMVETVNGHTENPQDDRRSLIVATLGKAGRCKRDCIITADGMKPLLHH